MVINTLEQERVSLVIETITSLMTETIIKRKVEGEDFCDRFANILLQVFTTTLILILFLFCSRDGTGK